MRQLVPASLNFFLFPLYFSLKWTLSNIFLRNAVKLTLYQTFFSLYDYKNNFIENEYRSMYIFQFKIKCSWFLSINITYADGAKGFSQIKFI